ncbi:MAG TPA: DUF6178 family protein [Blastocatellia bacterium]
MAKSVDRTHDSRAGIEQSEPPHPEGADDPSEKPAQRDATGRRHLLARILDTPGLEKVVPGLQPDLLHRVILNCGLEDCGELMALATSEQLERIFDLDLWRASQPGTDEQFDPDRFGLWIDVLVQAGVEVAAEKLAGMNVEVVVTGLARHVRVYDCAAITPYQTLDGEWIDAYCVDSDGLTCDISGYFLVAKRPDSWGAIIDVLLALGERHPDYLRRVMDGCRTLSNSGREVDGLDALLADEEQAMFDLGVDREGRRGKQGYVTPAHARAFLRMAREIRLDSAETPPANPLARAYFQALNEGAGEDTNQGPEEKPSAKVGGQSGCSTVGTKNQTDTPNETALGGSSSQSTQTAAESAEKSQGSSKGGAFEDVADAEASIFKILIEAGVVEKPRPLLRGPEGQAQRLGSIQAQMQFVADHDQGAYSKRNEELAYLANTLVAGCSIQGRPFTAREASDAAVAVCNLGLENWPRHWLPANGASLPVSFLVDHDLIGVFQVGWAVLHNDVCMYASRQLIEVLTRMRCDDTEIQVWLDRLRIRMAKQWRAGTPWHARDELEVIAMLDMPARAGLLGLIDECPVLHPFIDASQETTRRSVTTYDFAFISDNGQIASVREFMQSLPERLRD